MAGGTPVSPEVHYQRFLASQQLSDIPQCGLMNSPTQLWDLVGQGLLALRRSVFVLFPHIVGGCDRGGLGDYG